MRLQVAVSMSGAAPPFDHLLKTARSERPQPSLSSSVDVRSGGTAADFAEISAVARAAAQEAICSAAAMKSYIKGTLFFTSGCVIATMPMAYWLNSMQYRVSRIRNPGRVLLFSRATVGCVVASVVSLTLVMSPVGWWAWRGDLLNAQVAFDECYFAAEVARWKLLQLPHHGAVVDEVDEVTWAECMRKLHAAKQLTLSPLKRGAVTNPKGK